MMNRSDDPLREAIELLRQPVTRSEGAVDTVVTRAFDPRARQRSDALQAATRSGAFRWWRDRITRPRLVLSPLAATAWTLVVALAAAAAAALIWRAPAAGPGIPDNGLVRHQFVLVAPEAQSVSLVGDFNGWSVDATPLARRGEAWFVEVPLRRGRHVYSFVVDGSEWVADATAPRAAEDDFGRTNSVVIVGSTGP